MPPRLTPRKAVGVVSVVLTVISFCRVAVLYLESVSAVRAERAADAELLEACANGVARGSAKMRDACLRAQADRAAPIVFKAVVRAVSTAWREFTESCGSPFRLFLAVVFAIGVLAQPSVSWMRLLMGRRRRQPEIYEDGDESSDEDGGERSHYIVLDHSSTGRAPRGANFRRRIRGVLPKMLLGRNDASAYNASVREMEAQRHAMPQWDTIPLNDAKRHND